LCLCGGGKGEEREGRKEGRKVKWKEGEEGGMEQMRMRKENEERKGNGGGKGRKQGNKREEKVKVRKGRKSAN
jgi:hypothetical protein